MAKVIGVVYPLILSLTLLVQLRIVFAENKKAIQLKMDKLFKSNAVGPDVEATVEVETEADDIDNENEEDIEYEVY